MGLRIVGSSLPVREWNMRMWRIAAVALLLPAVQMAREAARSVPPLEDQVRWLGRVFGEHSAGMGGERDPL